MIVGIIGRGSVGQVGEPQPLPDRLQGAEELLLAVEATVGEVAPVAFELDLMGLDLNQPCPQGAGQVTRLLQLGLGVGRRDGESSHDPLMAQLVQGQPEKEAGIDATREGDQHRPQPTDQLARLLQSPRVVVVNGDDHGLPPA